jgi:dipeptidyl aminopeptidase/acylaminoacyl peptidase
MRAMLLVKLMSAALWTLTVVLACTAAWAAFHRTTAQDSSNPPRGSFAAAATQGGEKQASGASTLLVARRGGLITLRPDGMREAELTLTEEERTSFDGRLSPDGTRMAYLITTGGLRPPARVGEEPEPFAFKVVIRKFGAADPIAAVDLPAFQLNLMWAAGGKRVLVSKRTGVDANTAFETLLLDAQSGKAETLEVPPTVRVLDWSRDGKSYLVVHRADKQCRLGLLTQGQKEVRRLIDLRDSTFDHLGRFSPDGSTVLYTDADPADKDAHKWGLSSKPYLLRIAGKKREPLAEFPENGQAVGIAWSPDGKRVAYTWKQLHPELLKQETINVNDIATATEAFVMIADADGRNARTVYSDKADNAINMILGSVDWR